MHRKRLTHQRLALVVVAAAALAAAQPAVAAAAPDLSVTVSGPTAVGVSSPFTETATVTNKGTDPAIGVTVSYLASSVIIGPSPTPGVACSYVERGHSGRGGGYSIVGGTCSEALAAGLAPGHSTTVALTMTDAIAQTLPLTFTASPYPAAAQLNLIPHTATLTISVVRPPAAAAPTGVTAIESADQLAVHWLPASATAAYISGSVITATPVGGSTAPVLTATVTGNATTGVLPGVVASTQYAITVTNNDAGGTGASSAALLFTTAPATVVPGAPTITYAYGYADISWTAPTAGNSAIDEYEVSAVGGGQALTSYVSGSTLSAYLAPAPADSLAVTVRAHNAAGWGPWSAAVTFADGGGD